MQSIMPPKNCNLIPEIRPESTLKNPLSPEATADRSESKKDNSGEELGHEETNSEGRAEESSSSGRERLKRHRMEVEGRVWIPEHWGQEDFLEGWIDCTVFDSTLRNKGIMSARASLMEEGRRANSRIENRC